MLHLNLTIFFNSKQILENGVNNGSFITKQWIPDMCCGNRPYNSQIRMCCFGKTISRNIMRCCPDGTILPIDTIWWLNFNKF